MILHRYISFKSFASPEKPMRFYEFGSKENLQLTGLNENGDSIDFKIGKSKDLNQEYYCAETQQGDSYFGVY